MPPDEGLTLGRLANKPPRPAARCLELQMCSEMCFVDTFELHYDSSIQLSVFQAQAIAMAIRSRAPGCRLLVFGVGNDSGLWLNMNRDGVTHFLETSDVWAASVKAKYPEISVSMMQGFGFTVANSAALTRSDLAACPAPVEPYWDVILVDAPPGYVPSDPGRALAIYWASILAKPTSHVFVDDYERNIEKHFADQYLRQGRKGSNIILPASDSIQNRLLLWSMGTPH